MAFKTEDILKQRGARYGRFKNHAYLQEQLMTPLYNTAQWEEAPIYVREGVRMIMHKLARAFNGDVRYTDNFTDIAGYAKLVEQHLEEDCESN